MIASSRWRSLARRRRARGGLPASFLPAVILPAAILLAAAGCAASDPVESAEYQALEEEHAGALEEIEDLEDEVDDLEDEVGDLEDELSSAVAALDALDSSGDDVGTRLSDPDDYDASIEENFVTACTSVNQQEGMSEDAARRVCSCTFDAVVEVVPFEDFLAADQDPGGDPELEALMAELFTGCL